MADVSDTTANHSETPNGSIKTTDARPDIVPGMMSCAKCNFVLTRTTFYMGNGTTGPGDNKTEPCPNGCGPLWPLTWRRMAEDSIKQCEASLELTRDAEAEIEHLLLIIAWCRPRLRMGEYRTRLDGWLAAPRSTPHEPKGAETHG